MSRGLGRRERHVLEVCRAWAETEPDPGWQWVPMDALVEHCSTRSDREALRRAVVRLAEQGLVEQGATACPTWLLKRRAGDEWHNGPQAKPPPVHHYGGRGGHQLVVRLPRSPEERAAEEAERAARSAEVFARLRAAMAQLDADPRLR